MPGEGDCRDGAADGPICCGSGVIGVSEGVELHIRWPGPTRAIVGFADLTELGQEGETTKVSSLHLSYFPLCKFLLLVLVYMFLWYLS